MKKAAMIGSVLLLAAVMAAPALAWRGGPGGGPMMGGGWNAGPGGGPGPWSNLTEEQAKELNEARTKFFNDTMELRNQLQAKRLELRSLMYKSDTTKEALLAKNKEVQELANQLSDKRLEFRYDMHKKYPDLQGVGLRGFGRGRGFGPGAGFGGGPGAGFGPGYCGYGPGWGPRQMMW